MSKHTPGPWRLSKAGSFKILHDDVGLEIGQLSCTEDQARLIAAAPDMLEALKSAERVLQAQVRCEFNAGAPPTGTYHHTKLLEIQAAVAKAEGK